MRLEDKKRIDQAPAKSDADKKNTFDVERYIRVQRKKKKHPSAVIAPEEPFDLYEIELSDEDADFTAAE